MDKNKLGKSVVCQTKIKIYPDGTTVLTVYKNFRVYRGSAEKESLDVDVLDNSYNVSLYSGEKTEEEKEYEKLKNLWRIKTKIKDYILSNDFNYFWTLTFKDDRYDYDLAFKKMGKWLEKMRKKYGKFDYIMIPELHKDGAIHFHGVTGGLNALIVDAGVKHKGAKVYNCLEWEHGFTTLTKIRSREKTASYVTKYVTKEMQNSIVEKGKKKYWCSRGLRKPDITFTDLNLTPDLKPDYENDICAIYKL